MHNWQLSGGIVTKYSGTCDIVKVGITGAKYRMFRGSWIISQRQELQSEADNHAHTGTI
jgi:hypothetical protein